MCRYAEYLFLLAVFISLTALAQNPRGTLRGVIQDNSGARIPSAKVLVQAVESSFHREITADQQGEFRLENLLPGPYRVTVQARGFAEATSPVQVVVSSAREIMVKMRPAVQETVNVAGEASSITTQPIDATSAVEQGIVTAYDLEMLPLAH